VWCNGGQLHCRPQSGFVEGGAVVDGAAVGGAVEGISVVGLAYSYNTQLSTTVRRSPAPIADVTQRCQEKDVRGGLIFISLADAAEWQTAP